MVFTIYLYYNGIYNMPILYWYLQYTDIVKIKDSVYIYTV